MWRFSERLVNAGLISEEDATRAMEAAQHESLTLSRILVRDGLLRASEVAAMAALYLDLAVEEVRTRSLDPDTVALIPKEVARRYCALALERTGDRLKLAITDPTDLGAIQDLTARTGYTLELVVGDAQELQEVIEVAHRLVRDCCQSATLGQIGTRENCRYGEPALSSLTVRL